MSGTFPRLSTLTPLQSDSSQSGIVPDVAIITRTKNRVILLERCIKSILDQTFENWVHVIVNDGGDPDPVEKLLENYVNEYRGRVILIHNDQSLTMEAASNVGVNFSNSRFIAIHDDDDSWKPNFLSETASILSLHEPNCRIGGIATYAEVFNEKIEGNNVVTLSKHLFKELPSISLHEMLHANLFPPICLLFRRSALEAVGNFNSHMTVLGDWDFHLRLLEKFEILLLRQPLANYHHRPNISGGDDNSLGNSVYADKDAHLAVRSNYIDNILRESLKESNSRAILMSLSSLDSKLNSIKSDILFELKNHIDWRYEQLKEEILSANRHNS